MEQKIELSANKRILIRDEKGILERYIQEISPSGKFAKVYSPEGAYWRSVGMLKELIVEVLD